MYSPYEAGKLGEVICQYKLLQLHVDVRSVEMGAYDLIADYEGKLARIQVKTSQLKKNRNTGSYQYCITKGSATKRSLSHLDCDIVALVSLNQENCMFLPVWEVASCKTKRIKPEVFLNQDLAKETWNKAFTKAILYPPHQEPDQQYLS